MIRLEGVCKRFGDNLVLDNVSFALPDKGIVRLAGVSGKGKTTLLRIMAGLLEPDSGTVYRDERLRLSYVFQEDRLLPWITAKKNVELVSDREQSERWLSRVGLGAAADRRPQELSGGMRRRVALARALAYDGNVLLLDEPFSGLDIELRSKVILPLIMEYARNHPVVLVTHEAADIELLGNCLVIDI